MENMPYKVHEQYSLCDDEHKMFETCRRQEELNENINLKGAFCWLKLRNCITERGTKSINLLQPVY
jgi:hypothetical protein